MYPIERRKIALRVYSLFASLRKTAFIVDVSHSTVARWLRRIDRKKYTTSKVSKQVQIIQTIKEAIQSTPTATLGQLQKKIETLFNFTVSKELIRVAIKQQGITRKNVRFYGFPNNLQNKIEDFLQKRNEYVKTQSTFFSIDETSFGRNQRPVKGYSPKGQKIFVRKKQPRVTTTSVVACVSPTGMVKRHAVQGSINTLRFLDFLKACHIPEHTIVLLDNVRFHHSKVIKQYASDSNFVLLYTPPYSPWFNPIEMCFSVVKNNYYKNHDIDMAFSAVTGSHCKAFFQRSLTCSDRC